ncbi:MAG: type I restriction enzyme HsdR N-terminal domain-containing protein [Syntrophomonas sp.]
MILNLNLNDYEILDRYTRNNKKCVMDTVRKKLIVITPEEIVRQKILLYMQNLMEVPKKMIEVEVPMCYFMKGAKGRADILVYEEDVNEDCLRPVLVVECKAPNIELIDKVYDQAENYADVLSCPTIMVTNGERAEFLCWNEDENNYISLKYVPKYKDLVTKTNLHFDFTNPEWKRPKFSKINNKKIWEEYKDIGWIGEDSSDKLYPFLINLCGFLQDDSKLLNTPCLINGIKIIEDGGWRYTSFGNAAGGSWTGDYRFFIIEDEKGNNQIISIGIFGMLKCENHPVFGNRHGNTALVVAIDDFDKSHNSLQLNIDKYTKCDSKNKYVIWHDGTLTVGNKGAVKREDVVKFIKSKAPELVDHNGNIILGNLDNTTEINWSQRNTKAFMANLIKYALLRDDYRKQY